MVPYIETIPFESSIDKCVLSRLLRVETNHTLYIMNPINHLPQHTSVYHNRTTSNLGMADSGTSGAVGTSSGSSSGGRSSMVSARTRKGKGGNDDEPNYDHDPQQSGGGHHDDANNQHNDDEHGVFRFELANVVEDHSLFASAGTMRKV